MDSSKKNAPFSRSYAYFDSGTRDTCRDSEAKYFRVGNTIVSRASVSGRLAWKQRAIPRRGLKTIIWPTTRLISVSRVPARHATHNESPTPLKLRYNRAKTISSWNVIALRKNSPCITMLIYMPESLAERDKTRGETCSILDEKSTDQRLLVYWKFSSSIE